MEYQVIPFYGHTNGSYKSFSQYYMASFIIDGRKYNCAEQWMMASKAKMFEGNDNIFQEIMKETKPANIKSFGRMVTNYDEAIWSNSRYDIVVKGNMAKFSQNKDLKLILLSTGNAILVEASPIDKIWGVGMAITHPNIKDPTKWQGTNLLGKALMEVREKLKLENTK